MQENIEYAVIGHPIGHTMSPYIHTRLFKLQNKTVNYSKLDISPDALKDSFSSLKTLKGFNVTIPHKQSIIQFIDKLDSSALKYGAVNCVDTKDGITYGYNTDAYGFIKSLESNNVKLEGKVLICGSGGVARTFAKESIGCGCDVYIAAINNESEYLKSELDFTSIEYSQINGGFDIIINATPVGMYPKCDNAILSENQLAGCKVLFDAVYNPCKTKLLQIAEKSGITAIGGMSMLVWQAVKAHEIWYDAKFDLDDINNLIADANMALGEIFGEKE
ncbi:MAG: shikimate dehydrogenase [Acutalibacteraceae bacterium]|nr:shikimate dehydrogenase [Acutalibacteraceae bacterium]